MPGPRAAAIALAEHLDLVPVEVREEIKLRLVTSRVRSYEDFVDCAQYIMAETLSGNIPPEAADVARKYLELILTALVMDQTPDAQVGYYDNDLSRRLAAASKDAQRMAAPIRKTVKEAR